MLIGAGFIGCIILEALAKRCGTLTVVEMEERMVSRMMDETAGGMLERWCATKNIRVLTSTRVAAIEAATGTGGDKAVVLDNGERIDAHLVVLAVGVAPNIGFLEGSGIKDRARRARRSASGDERGRRVRRRRRGSGPRFLHRRVLGARDSADRDRARPHRGAQHAGASCPLQGQPQHECARHGGPGFQLVRQLGRRCRRR